MDIILANEIIYQVYILPILVRLNYKIFLYLTPKGLRSCSCVCREWRDLIKDCKRLLFIRDKLDPHDKIYIKDGLESDKIGFTFFASVTLFMDKIIVTDVSDDKLKIRDSKNLTLTCNTQAFRGIGRPYGICTPESNILVADYDTREIQVLDQDYNLVSSIPLSGFHPQRICTTPKEHIVVTTCENIVLVLDKDGSIVEQFGSADQFGGVEGVCSNSKGEIIISDYKKNRIQIFNENGQLLREFGSQGGDIDQFNGPCGICTDWQDNIYVADNHNSRISIFDPMGNPMQQIPVHKPVDICLAGRQMIVTNLNGSIYIFSN